MVYEIGYPVDFRSTGDTTREAFAKHINEIKRIYGYLNDLELKIKKAAANILSELEEQNATKPSYSFTEITGNLDASRVSGELTNATIDVSKLLGLAGNITFEHKKATTITTDDSTQFAIKLNNSPIIVGGTATTSALGAISTHDGTFSGVYTSIPFGYDFEHEVLSVVLTMGTFIPPSESTMKWIENGKITLGLAQTSLSRFWYYIYADMTEDEINANDGFHRYLPISWIAVGY